MGCAATCGIAKPTGKSEVSRTPVDFASPETLWALLAKGNVRLLRATWLLAQPEGFVLRRRQELPPEAFISRAELLAIYEASNAIPSTEADQPSRMPIISVSHFWRTKQHADPEGITINLVTNAIRQRWSNYARPKIPVDRECWYGPRVETYGFTDMGIFMDWGSLFQEPRDEGLGEVTAFKDSLKAVNVWYAHQLVTCYLITEMPTDGSILPYHERGWTSFEYQLSWMVKICERSNVWPQVVDLGGKFEVRDVNGYGNMQLVNTSASCRRPAPCTPDAFEEGGEHGRKHFTAGADRGVVAKRFRETVEDVFTSMELLSYGNLGWGDAEFLTLGRVFPLCHSLRTLHIGQNLMTCLPDSLGVLKHLEEFASSRCPNLEAIPKSFGQLSSLRRVYLWECSALQTLPETIGELGKLQVLQLSRCTSLTSLPNAIGKLASLIELGIDGCMSLGRVQCDADSVRCRAPDGEWGPPIPLSIVLSQEGTRTSYGSTFDESQSD
jgi:hypothetical protein